MIQYNYRPLGSTCAPQGAYTNNAKYIAPMAPVYEDRYTYMLRYPGSTTNEGKTYVPKHEELKHPSDHHHSPPVQQIRIGCHNCATKN